MINMTLYRGQTVICYKKGTYALKQSISDASKVTNDAISDLRDVTQN